MTALEQHRWAERIVDSSTLAAFTFLVWQTLTSLDEEVEWIWSKPRWSWTKWIFLSARYMAILVLFIEVIGDRVRAALPSCPAWFAWQGVALQFSLGAVDLLLMIRVYALYNRSLLIVRVLTFLWISAQGAMSWALATSIPDYEYTRRCVITKTPLAILWFAIGTLIFQSALFLLTAYKFVVAARAGWGRTALMALLMRDGTWAYALVFMVITLHHILVVVLRDNVNSIVYPWMISISSFSGCRIVLNMHTLDDSSADSSDPLSRYRIRARSHHRPRRVATHTNQLTTLDAAATSAYFTTMGQGIMLTTFTRPDFASIEEDDLDEDSDGPSSSLPLPKPSGTTLVSRRTPFPQRTDDRDDAGSMVFSPRHDSYEDMREEYDMSTTAAGSASQPGSVLSHDGPRPFP
ncbi:hypothetical protein PUNSTDRAFT_128712 [Punctularia strigosozonata HHB-11173 SS5]|uniref:DUF6533 domain-containing protein n=1 Tax=Punctularia strigosozonata (strain HHB-11173) TaxID=741275 RepID=R7S180_PUNST|nr:uncharacterized protein PUNSTDRAFT_128712 [Punctularia strigosozonata HHB-11173 SS5]EIN03547.1 hypothetical protein PUNSTDRAFT_128712 [Punctularia strigosozonata HHB-11173 SS5]